MLISFVFRAWILTGLGSALVEDDGPRKSDAILSLGGDDYGTRILKAAELQKAGYAPVVYVSGPSTLLGYESDATIEYARRHGYPVSIFRPVDHHGKSTRSETAILGEIFKSAGVRKLLLVTSNYHTHRAAWLFRKELPWLEVAVVPASDPYFTPQAWWKTREGEKIFLLEWTKTFAAKLGD